MSDRELLKIACPQCGKHLDVSDLDCFAVVRCPRCDAPIRVPRQFGQFWLDHRCGCGGVGEVFCATDTQSGKKVALKIAFPEASAEMRPLFDHSVEWLRGVDHPHILPLYQSFCIENRAVLSMKYLPNGGLTPPLADWETTRGYFGDLLSALAELKKHRIVHHDLKPANFLLDENFRIVLCDFDTADRREIGDRATQCPGWGSPEYASPERLLGGGEDFSGDLFSLGVSFYELLAGQLPFGDEPSRNVQYRRRRNHDFIPLDQLRPDLPADFGKTIDRMLNFSPDDRPEVEELLASWRRR